MTGLILYHAAPSRSSGAVTLLKELDAPYDLRLISLKKEEQLTPEFRAINPMGKVPVILHDGAVITEQVAIFIYLADMFPAAKLAPALGDPDRGPYLRWLAFYGSSFEPAVIDRHRGTEPGYRGMSPYGDFDTMIGALEAQLAKGPYILGERYSAADVLWGAALNWMLKWKLVPASDVFEAYVARHEARPAVIWAHAQDAIWHKASE
jgi:glutathione S-transferase